MNKNFRLIAKIRPNQNMTKRVARGWTWRKILAGVSMSGLIIVPAAYLFVQTSSAAVGTVYPDGDVAGGTQFVTCQTNGNGSCRYGVVDEPTLITGDYLETGTGMNSNAEEEFTMTSVAGAVGTVSQVVVKVQAHASGGCASTCDDLQIRIFIDGSYQSAQTVTLSATSTLHTATFSGLSATGDDDLQVEVTRVVQGGGNPSSRDDNARIYQIYAEVTYTVPVTLTQSGYRFYNNSDSTDVGSPLAALNTTATLGSAGADFRLRQSIHADGGNLAQNGQNFTLQYAGKGSGTCQAPSGGVPATYTNVGIGGSEWKPPTWEKRNAFKAVTFDGKMWVIGGFAGFSALGSFSDVWYSTDGLSWTLATDSPGWVARQLHSVAVFDNKMWVIGGYDGTNYLDDVWYSSDGTNWTEATSSAAFGGLARSEAQGFNNKLWLMGGWDGSNYVNDLWSSSDGVTWTHETSPGWVARGYHETTVFNSKLWLMGGYTGSANLRDVWSSTNGTSWTQETNAADWSARQTFGLTSANGKMWAMGGYDNARLNDVWSSSDGVNWTQVTGNAAWSVRSYHESLTFNNKIWVMGGFDGDSYNDVWSSSDGSSWTANLGGLSRRQGHMGTIHDGEMWIAGGFDGTAYNNGVLHSSDGINWVKATDNAAWSGRLGGALLSFNNKLWLMGGYNGSSRLNDVWSSSDGISWTQETASANWQGRNYFGATVYDGKMWVMGGINAAGSAVLNDVWYSSNGVNWTQATGGASWATRYGPYSTVFNGKLYLIGGGGTGAGFNDVWSSTDGASWTQETGSAAWSGRLQPAGAVFDGRIWIYGGRGNNSDAEATLNDLWSSRDGVNWVQERASVMLAPRYITVMFGYNDRLWIAGGDDSAIGATGAIRSAMKPVIDWNDNPTPSDNAALTDNANDPSHSGHTIINQSYLETNGFTNSQAGINSGQDGLWDFSLRDNGAPANTTYCFRVVNLSGSPLAAYSTYPEITTSSGSVGPTPTPTPQMDQLLHGGNWWKDGARQWLHLD